MVMLLLNYAIMLWLFRGWYKYWIITSLVRGFATGLVVFATHYGEDILEPEHTLSLVEQTALTSRNITGGFLVNILTGFISLQTEHHLW
jgi:fatty acid desaturase